MKTLILYLDALGYRFISKENTPFLYNYGKENSLLRLKTLLAYTGIEHTFITGELPSESGIWTGFVYKKNYIGKILRFIPLPNSILSYPYALMNYYLSGNTYLSKLYHIPRKFFGKFNSGTKHKIWKKDFFQKRSFVYYGWPFFVQNNKVKLDFIKRNDEYKVKKFINSFNDNTDIYFIQLVDLDKTMHEFGTVNEDTIKELRRQDSYASIIVNEFKAKFPDSRVIIWSDHGFIDIKEEINIGEKIKNFKNIDYFLDSTIARFWFKSEKDREEIIRILSRIRHGKILDLKDKDKYNIPLGKEFGEVIFVLEPGYLFVPNFHQGKIGCRGMHGYMPDKADLDGIFIINKKINKKEIELNEVLGLIEYGNLQV